MRATCVPGNFATVVNSSFPQPVLTISCSFYQRPPK
jgi:hypothetical protein